MSPMLSAALGYTESSPQWPMIPIRPADKRPLISTGTDHAEHASTDPTVIRGWFQAHPDTWIGMPTGWPSMTIVIDVDAKHDGESLLAEAEAALGPLPRVRVVRTRSGGLHLYYRRPVTPFRIRSGAGPKSQLGKLLGGRAGVDVRADGGLVVLPPTPGYVWIADDDEPPPELPAIWLAAICGAGDEPYRPTTRAPVVDDDTRVRRARAYLARIPGAVEGNGGHDQTFEAARAALIGFDLDESTARNLLEDYNGRCDPPWSEKEIDHKIRSAAKSRLPRGYLLDRTAP